MWELKLGQTDFSTSQDWELVESGESDLKPGDFHVSGSHVGWQSSPHTLFIFLPSFIYSALK